MLLVPLPPSGLVAKRSLFFFQRMRQLSLGRANGLLLFGERHEDPFRARPMSEVAATLRDMTNLYSKNGRPLQRDGERLFARSGTYLGTINGQYVFDTTGRYTGTIDGDRVVYRSVDSARIGSPTVATPRIDSIAINAVPAAILGDEPPFPD